MKIAIATDDGQTVSAHFGRASRFLVVTVEQGKVIDRELRAKPSHNHAVHREHAEAPGQPHGLDAAAQDHHVRIGATIQDCEAMLCRGMGAGAYSTLESMKIRPFLIDIAPVDQAIGAYVDGSLTDHPERLH